MATMHTSPVDIRSGALRLSLRPDIGGSVAGLWHGDLPVWRSADPLTLAQPREGANFPLVPYSGRIGYRRFRWQGRDHTTLANFGDNPHSLHGVGWTRAWRVVQAEDDAVELALTHRPDAEWPFAFEATQGFMLDPQGLRATMSITNTGDVTAPVGLGWHPYFPRRERSRVHAEISGRWETDPFELPNRCVPQPGIDADVAHLSYDHCFEGWQGAARVRDERVRVAITSSLPYLVVYTPPQQDYFCVEPVSHVPNAIHMSEPARHGVRALAAGETFTAWMRVDVSPV
jgi:aldose 1-epimerase